MAAGVYTPYSGVSGYLAALPAWVPADEQERIAAYGIYEQIYWNHPETFKLVLRGDETNPIYLPSARTIVEAANRFTGKGLKVTPDPAFGTPNDQAALTLACNDLMARERFLSLYNANKRYGIMRGDWLFHIRADVLKLPGSRLSIHTVDPSSYFVVPMPDDEERIWKIHLAEQIKNAAGDVLVRRQTYTKMDNGQILSECSDFKIDEWSKPDGQAVQQVIPPLLLPPQVTAFPVYHIKNTEEPGNPYGSSEIRGVERLVAAINQGITDEDISLAMDGLGVYTTDAGGPVDEDGEDAEWVIGPGRVVENANNFRRVNGVNSTQPYISHMDYIKDFAYEATGTSDMAIGKVDVSVAESGIALALRMAPMLSKAEEKDDIIKAVLSNMWFDLATMWFPAFEQQSFGDARPMVSFGDKLPKNRKTEVELIVELMSTTVPIMSAQTARKHLAKYDFEFEPNEAELIAQEQGGAATADVTQPDVVERFRQELNAGG